MSSLAFYGIYYSNIGDKNLFFIISVMTIFVFGGTTIFLVRNMFLQIKKFTENTEGCSSDSCTLLKMEKSDELGQLGNSINNLSKKFLKKSKDYEEKILELEIV